jgi:hypothetical protein
MRTTGTMLAVAAGLAIGAGAFAQQPPAAPAQKNAANPETVTITGCVQKEADVLKRNPVAGSVGMSDEFVLTNASLAAPSSQAPTTEPPPPAATGTSGSAGNFGIVYRTTGDKESDLKSYVGQRVEINGTFKDKDAMKDAMSSAGAGGRPGELTPANTPEITIDSIKPATGTCAPVIK